MSTPFIDPRGEAPALRRAAVLLERIRQDAGRPDAELEALEAGVCTMRRAAAAGRLIHESAIDRMETLLAALPPAKPSPSHGDFYELLRFNAIDETREFLARLAGTPSTAPRAVEQRALARAAS